MLRFLRYALECIAGIVGVGIVLALLLVWRLNSSPISSDFFTPYIEDGIESLIPGSHVQAKNTLFTWGDAEKSVSVHADHIIVTSADGIEITDIPSFDAKISIIGLIFGQFLPKDLVIDHPQIKLERNAEGAFSFGDMSVGGGAPPPANPSPEAAKKTEFVIHNIAERLSHAALMHKLAVTGAVVNVHDDGTKQDWAISIPDISIMRKVVTTVDHKIEYGALEGRMTVEVTQKDAIASLDVKYGYDPEKAQHHFSTLFNAVTPADIAGGHPETLGLKAAAFLDLPVTGNVQITLDRNLSIVSLDAQMHADEGHVTYTPFWENPVPIQSIDLNASYDRDLRTFKISNAHIDFKGPSIDLDVDGTPSDDPTQIDTITFLQVDNLPMNRFDELWPKAALPDARYWLVANLRDGIFTHAEMKLKGTFAHNDLSTFSPTSADGKMSAVNGRVTYLEGMTPVSGVNADATFDLSHMSVQINTGVIGNMRLLPFAMQINGLNVDDQDIDIPLKVEGPIPEVLRLLDEPPLGYAKKLGIQPDDLTGNLDGTVSFKFPLEKTLQMKDVAITANATATSVASSKLIPGLILDQGNLSLALDMSGFTVKGQASLNKVPFQVTWQENFNEEGGKPLRVATVAGAITEDQWSNFGITAFDGTKGPISVALTMIKPKASKMVYSGVVDMSQAALKFDFLNWKKAAAVPATLKFTADAPLGKPVELTSLSLRGLQISADGTATLSPDFSQLLAMDLSSFNLGRTNASLHFKQIYGPSGELAFEATGASLDVSGLRGDKDPGKADPRPKEYHIKVQKLFLGDEGEIDNAEGSATRDQEGWSAISLHGLAEGDTPLSIELTPQPDGHRTLSITCDDFGKAMQGLAFTSAIKGGKLLVTGQSTIDQPRIVLGTAKINDFTVEKLPVLALLLNATSPFGFKDILTDSAAFSRFEGDFKWQQNDLVLTHAHAAGSAVGINVDGRVNMNNGDSNLQGTLVPFSTVNSMLGYIPLLGNLITGGKDEGVLAVSYTIKGPLSAPQLSVNPVSLLTPGFIRNLFFRDTTTDEPPAATPSPAVAPAAVPTTAPASDPPLDDPKK